MRNSILETNHIHWDFPNWVTDKSVKGARTSELKGVIWSNLLEPLLQAPGGHAEVPSMSVSGMSGWERGLGAQTFANMNRHFEQEPSFAGQTWRYLGGREPSLDTSLASFAVPVYRGSDAGEEISKRGRGAAWTLFCSKFVI